MKSGGSFKPTHGESFATGRTVEYTAWVNIIARCENQSRLDFDRYGGRGIKVCPRWRGSYEAFLADMGRRPSAQHSIDRIDVNGDYEPGNCRWATQVEQARNNRNNRVLTALGESMCIAAWEERTGISSWTIRQRLDKLGWDADRAVTEPVAPTTYTFHGRELTLRELVAASGVPDSSLRRRLAECDGDAAAAVAAYHSNNRGKRPSKAA